jgi:hypothetical protein
VKSFVNAGLAGLLLLAAFFGGTYVERWVAKRGAAADTRLVTTVGIFECGQIKALILVPQHSAPLFKDGSDGIPLAFYLDSVRLSINGVVRLNIPCPKQDTLAQNK